MVHWTQTAANYLGAGLFVIAKKRRGCTTVPLCYLIRFPLAKGVNLYLWVHADCWCVQKIWWFYLLALVERNKYPMIFKALYRPALSCTFSFCLSEFFSPLLCYAGPALGGSAFTLWSLCMWLYPNLWIQLSSLFWYLQIILSSADLSKCCFKFSDLWPE